MKTIRPLIILVLPFFMASQQPKYNTNPQSQNPIPNWLEFPSSPLRSEITVPISIAAQSAIKSIKWEVVKGTLIFDSNDSLKIKYTSPKDFVGTDDLKATITFSSGEIKSLANKILSVNSGAECSQVFLENIDGDQYHYHIPIHGHVWIGVDNCYDRFGPFQLLRQSDNAALFSRDDFSRGAIVTGPDDIFVKHLDMAGNFGGAAHTVETDGLYSTQHPSYLIRGNIQVKLKVFVSSTDGIPPCNQKKCF